MHRTPQLKEQARMLREAYAQKGASLAVGESLELVAKMNGYASWNAASAAQRQATQPDEARRITVQVTSWSIVHHHKHGEDVFNVYRDTAPSDDEAISIINAQGGGYEPEYDEWFEVLGRDTQTLTLSLGELEAKVVPTPMYQDRVVRVFEVDMTDNFEYDTPDQLPAWTWIQANGSFAHRGNDKEPGVWEFLVYTSRALEDQTCPAELKVFFAQAKKADCPWVMFHQG